MKAYASTACSIALLLGMPASAETTVSILPTATADRTFQFVQPARTFLGTPLEIDSLTPYALFVVGQEEDQQLFTQAATMAFMIGQWAQDPGTSLEAVRANRNLGPVVLDVELTDEHVAERNLVVLGSKNRLYAKLAPRLQGTGSFIQVIPDGLAPGRDVMFVSDETAAAYLANKRLYFKAGAYKGFYNFAKIRALLERGDFSEALNSLDDPDGVRGCGKPVILAIGHKEKLPRQMLDMAAKRNKLVFQDLRKWLKLGAQQAATVTWQSAMETCYACHQGQDGVKRYRNFVPNEQEHFHHTKTATRMGLGCDTCHKGKAAMAGYQAAR